MNFQDSSTIEGSPTKVAGVQFISECGLWRVTASDHPRGGSPDEWHVWQMVRGADQRNPHGLGFVRRLSRARFVTREAAGAAAALLAALPATMSARVVRNAVTDLLRGMTARLLFEAAAVGHALLIAKREPQ